MNSRLLRLCALAIGAPLVLAACGGSSGSAAASSTSTTARGGRAAQSSAFSACLRQQGVTLPAGGFGGNGGAPPGGGGGPAGATGARPTGGGAPSISVPGVSQQKLQSAFSACRSKLPTGGGFGGGVGANTQALQAYTSCLSDHGVQVPTTTSGSAASGAGGGGGGLGALRSDPEIAAANKVCQALLPARGGSTTTTTAG